MADRHIVGLSAAEGGSALPANLCVWVALAEATACIGSTGDRIAGRQPQSQEAGRIASGARRGRPHGADVGVSARRAPFDEAPETGATFEDNALAKARDAFAATGLASVADDSGLQVVALNGMPGVLSARWSGAHGDDAANTALLLAQLRDVPDERRGAAFVSACALAGPSGEVVVRAEWLRQHRPRTPGRRWFWL